MRIPVVNPYMPDQKKYERLISKIYDRGWLTNQGPFVQELEERLSEYLGVKRIICVSSGSAALHLAYKICNLHSRVVTSPFSYIATSSTLAWDELSPSFCDIHPMSLNLDVSNLKNYDFQEISGIVTTLVYGNPFGLKELEDKCKEENIPLILDAAHAFDIRVDNQSVLTTGRAASISFHATKVFHTIEGGALVVNSDEDEELARSYINFGINGENFLASGGTNFKMNEFEAAMGICVLDDIDFILERRREIGELYNKDLDNICLRPEWMDGIKNNHSYAPFIFKSEKECLSVHNSLSAHGIQSRRYFYPSLDKVYDNIGDKSCDISRELAGKILCLPIYPGLNPKDQMHIIKIVKESLNAL